MIELDGNKYLTLPEKFEEATKDIKDIKNSVETIKKLVNEFKPLIQGVVAFISDENVDSLSKVQLCNKIGEHLNKNMEKGE